MPTQKQGAHYDLDGFFESPHDNPPQWALMLTAYFDESFEGPDGYAVMAGFLGNKRSWLKCAEAWRSALGQNRSLHMKKLRGWKRDRNKSLLATLGAIPHACDLQPVFAAVRLSDYRDDLKKYGGPVSNGYFVTLVGAVSAIPETLPPSERVELIFEQQTEYAFVREYALKVISKLPQYRKKGKRLIAKSSTIPKSILLEPSDYLAYALMQTLVDPYSRRAQLCSPILKQGKRRIGGRMSEKEVRRILPFRPKVDLPL